MLSNPCLNKQDYTTSLRMESRFHLVEDAKCICVLMLLSLCTGLMNNAVRHKPIPLIYRTPSERINQQVECLVACGTANAQKAPRRIERKEVLKCVINKSALFIDARPELFFSISHVPGAISITREDFKDCYSKNVRMLWGSTNCTIIVYCSHASCDDGRLVALGLMKLGLPNVALYENGWDELENSHLLE